MGTQMIYKCIAPKISQLIKCHTHFIHVANHFILSNLAGVWSRGIFDSIVINGETISHAVRDLGVYIDSSINLADHVPRLTTRTCFFQIRQSRSIHPLLSIKFSHTLCDGYGFSRLLQRTSWWKPMRSVSSVRYLANQKRYRAALL